eukprot:4643747-Pyramimonas_sp.AAC.1
MSQLKWNDRLPIVSLARSCGNTSLLPIGRALDLSGHRSAWLHVAHGVPSHAAPATRAASWPLSVKLNALERWPSAAPWR